MASHVEVGKEGEKLAEAWLAQNGYTILHRNWRYRHFELDLVASKNGKLRVVEVKLRKSNKYGYPEQAVTRKKYNDLLKAVQQFLFLNPQHKDFRIDVLSITQHSPVDIDYFLIEDLCL